MRTYPRNNSEYYGWLPDMGGIKAENQNEPFRCRKDLEFACGMTLRAAAAISTSTRTIVYPDATTSTWSLHSQAGNAARYFTNRSVPGKRMG